jgi:diguanylate cyclase (GGDEF)-like protein
MKQWFLRIGIIRACILIVVLATLLSLVITSIVLNIMGEEMTGTAIVAAVVTPAITATIFSIIVLRLVYDLDEAERTNKTLARTDDLTGLHNRRSYLEIAGREIERAQRFGHEFALIAFDIDDLKRINDKYGHLVGDKVLKQIASACKEVVRSTDVIARLGGDEFVILVIESKKLNIDDYMGRLANRITGIGIGKEIKEPITASMGAKRYTSEIKTIDDMYSAADREMYVSKRNNSS